MFIVIGSFLGYRALTGNKNTVRYVMAAVEKGTIITSVSGSGQVSVSNQIDIKPKVSGDVIYVGAKEGQEVKNGQLIVKIDDSDAQKAVRDAETNLETTQISPSQTEDDLKKTYDDGFNEITNVFLDLPNIMSGLKTILFSDSLGKTGNRNINNYEDSVKPYDRKKSSIRKRYLIHLISKSKYVLRTKL